MKIHSFSVSITNERRKLLRGKGICLIIILLITNLFHYFSSTFLYTNDFYFFKIIHEKCFKLILNNST